LTRTSEKAEPPKRPFWTGRISLGLVNVPVKVLTMIRDKSFSFKFLRKDDGCPLKYNRVCSQDGKIVEWDDIVRGYEVRKDEFVMFTKEELQALRPESDQKIRLDKFVHFLSIDPIYFDKSYILVPDKSEDAYSLLLETLKTQGLAGIGMLALRNKEHPALVHEYKDILVLTILRYAYEIVDPADIEELQKLPKPKDEELKLATTIIENLSGEFDITEYRDTFKERVESLIEKKMKGETIIIEEPKKEEVKELMVALKETLAQLQEK